MRLSESLVIAAALAIFLSTALQLALAPFSKVEESFNLHAIHDFIHQPSYSAVAHHGDHLTFPGPVPRTFIGSIILASLATPLIPLARFLGLVHSKFAEQILCRAILALINASAIVYFGLSARFVFGNLVAAGMLLLSACQFHLPFYASRTLPNMFAFPIVQIALGQYMVTMRRTHAATSSRKRRTLRACSLLTFGAIVFRLELLALLAPITLLSLLSRRVTFWELISRGFLATFAALEMTLPIDSYFWQRLTWPEGASVIFNVIEGNAKQWGVMPWHFYFTSSLPKLLGISYPLAVLGFVLNRKMFLLGLSTLVFVCGMSGLGHKETRFIIYIVPVWNLSTAIGVHRLSSLVWNSAAVRVALFAAVGGGALVSTLLSTYLSMHNYPGGEALLRLHALADGLRPLQGTLSVSPTMARQEALTRARTGGTLRVHLDDLVCQSGASRFLQLRDADGWARYPSPGGGGPWTYDKLANLSTEAHTFDAVVSERTHLEGFEPLTHVSAFDRLTVRRFESSLVDRLRQVVGEVIRSWCLRHAWTKFVDLIVPVQVRFDEHRVTVFRKLTK